MNPIAVEIMLNPNGKARGLGIAEFSSTKEADFCVENFKGTDGSDAFARPLINMTFPDVINGCCSFKSVLNNTNVL